MYKRQDVTYDDGNGPTTVSGVSGDITVGPFAAGAIVDVTVADSADGTCNATSSITTPIACPPAEDNCMGAITIPVTPDNCIGITTGNNTGATDSNNDVPAPPAATCTAYNGGDIWFKLTVPASGNVTISGAPSPGCCSFLWYEVYTGTTCSDLASLVCSSTNGNDPSLFETILNGQVPGSTLWIRAWDSNNDNGPGEFNFCAKEVLPVANDECNSAEVIIESSDINCNNSESSTTLNATVSANNDCSFSPDVWFELQAVSSSITVTSTNLMPAGSSGLVPVSTVLMVYETCTGTNIACAFSPVTFTAIPGNTYYIAASTRDVNNFTAAATFDICAYPTPQPPINDACVDAVGITPSNTDACENKVAGTTYFSTFSSENICAGGGNDVWYSFVASANTLGVLVDNLQPTPAGGVPANAVVGVFSGACGSFTQLACVFDNIEIPVTIGETYYISVTCRDAGNFPVFSDFDVCVYNPPPLNDNCENSTVLAVNDSGSLINQSFAGAEASGIGTEICDVAGTPTPRDVWYSVTTIQNFADLTITVEPGPNSDLVVAVYEACGSPIPEQCVDLAGNGGNETINFSADANTEYFVRVYEKIVSGQPFEIEVEAVGYCSGGDNTFTGTDGNWNISSNWTGCIPSGPYVGTLTIMGSVNTMTLGDFELTGDLIIQDGAIFEHNNGNSFTVNGDIILEDGGNINNTSTLITTDQ